MLTAITKKPFSCIDVFRTPPCQVEKASDRRWWFPKLLAYRRPNRDVRRPACFLFSMSWATGINAEFRRCKLNYSFRLAIRLAWPNLMPSFYCTTLRICSMTSLSHNLTTQGNTTVFLPLERVYQDSTNAVEYFMQNERAKRHKTYI